MGYREDRIALEDALELSKDELKGLYRDHVNPGLVKMLSLLGLDKQFVRAEGTSVWDSSGREYMDFLGGFGSLNFGHNHPRIVEAVETVRQLPNLLQSAMGVLEACAAHNLALVTPGALSHTFFCNSGTEAVEGALKLARKATGRKGIIYCRNSFHGKSLGSLSVTGRRKYQQDYEPLLPECRPISFGDLDALEAALGEDVAAYIVEPVQGEGGIILAPLGYLREAGELCRRAGALLIVDEIQTGFGRTGLDFACQHDGCVPDILCAAKSLGGGVVPVGAFTTTREIWETSYGSLDTCLLHTSTFGGNARACAAVMASLDLLNDEQLSEQARKKGSYLLERLEELAEQHEMIKEVRGKGLLLGIEFYQPEKGLLKTVSRGFLNRVSHKYLGAMVCGMLQNKYRIITAYTLNNPNVLRLEPPLIVDYEELDRLVEALEEIFSGSGSLLGMAFESSRMAFSSIFRDGGRDNAQ